MQKLKNISYFIILVTTLISCSKYNRVLNKGSVAEKYKMAVDFYEAQKYSKALSLFEKVIPSLRGKPQMERIQFMVANSNFNLKDYPTAGYYFGRFAKNYPKSSKVEEAEFLSALSYYKSSPRYSLDPTDTQKALDAMQAFIDKYPNSSRIEEANKYHQELRFKLERKAFEIAKTYYRTADYDSRNYRAAITAFDNLLSDYLGTKFKEEALYYRLKTAHDYAFKSTTRRKPERIEMALKSYKKLKKSFPKSQFMKDSDKMFERLTKEQKRIEKIIKG